MALFFILACTLIFVAIASYAQYARWQKGKGRLGGHEKASSSSSKLPPGSMGWPYLGDTLQLYSQDPNVFFASKQKRYGEIFKTHLLGCPCVMLASPEAARFVLVTQAHLFKPTYPRSKERMIGPSALFFHQGDYHLRLRKLVQGALGPDALRALVPEVESAVRSTLAAWDGQVRSTFDAMKTLSFDVGILAIFGGGGLDERRKAELRKNYSIVEKGYNSFPNSIPGTLYYKAMQARRRLHGVLIDVMRERRERGAPGTDLLGCLMRSQGDDDGARRPLLTDDQVADNIIGVLFAAQDTTASALTWAVKYLHDHPKLLEAVRAEQAAVREATGGGRRPLTWAHTRSMALTHRVILESLRMASIISFTFREAVADVEYKGFLIPKGWKVMPLFRNIHHSPDYFQDPHKFDPSRFQVAPRPNTFLPFGSGVHACPGNELAKLEMLVLIHHLVTAYRWETVGSSDEVEYRPFPVPKQGLPVRLWRESSAAVDRNGRHETDDDVEDIIV
ncbi:abscisic acid 8'-hydroxylase 3 [Zea mays]|uniref:(+)-abscisic acid 8'-hydroxylase n=1 Tax=Zea mays TaxID=4577 RepID=A0A804MNV2_MAIZE|nr:abscisic acid 8'-hydroxylase 3 [Zea mays]|eukprot:XP_008670237.1 abscisic acid 8'-hydroxylase 3 [Zea mays]